MSVVLFYDRESGKILKVEHHPDWGEREVKLNHYRSHPGTWPDRAGILTVPPGVKWDNEPENWIVHLTPHGNPWLRRREEVALEEEINRAKEEALYELIKSRLSPKAAAYWEQRIKKGMASSSNSEGGTT